MRKGAGKEKGSSFERTVARLFDSYWNVPKNTFWRTPLSGGWHEVGDVAPRDRSIWFPFIIECKSYKTLDLLQLLTRMKTTKLYKWWEQVSKDAEKAKGTQRDPSTCKRLLIIKINYMPILCVYSPEELPFGSLTLEDDCRKQFRVFLGNEQIVLCLFSTFQQRFSQEYLDKFCNKNYIEKV